MKIRILKPFETNKGQLAKGDILDITPSVAECWDEKGEAEFVREPYRKVVPENKVITPCESKIVRRKARKAKK